MSDDERRAAVAECERRLHIMSALARALDDPQMVLGLLVSAADVDAARAALRVSLGVDEVQANAILDLQWRRAPKSERETIRADQDHLTQVLRDLQAGRTGPG
ncbi:hypothetical protein [Nocardioides sp.]|uniref:hypothetical protein n=1 Tax=Nocardioides sp. TaxID=35761 RepID=UPI0037847D7B